MKILYRIIDDLIVTRSDCYITGKQFTFTHMVQNRESESKLAFIRVDHVTYDIKYSSKFVPLRTPH